MESYFRGSSSDSVPKPYCLFSHCIFLYASADGLSNANCRMLELLPLLIADRTSVTANCRTLGLLLLFKKAQCIFQARFSFFPWLHLLSTLQGAGRVEEDQ